MKRFFCAALALLIVVGLVPAGLAEALPRELTLAPGESREFALPFAGFWDSDAPEVATASGGVITGHEEGFLRFAAIPLIPSQFSLRKALFPANENRLISGIFGDYFSCISKGIVLIFLVIAVLGAKSYPMLTRSSPN